MTPIDRRSEILEQIRQCVCKDRCNTHGDAEDNFADIATLWTWWIKARYGVVIQLDALDSAEMMNLMKSTRKAKTPLHLDHWVDGGGYNVCGAGIVKKALDEQAQTEAFLKEMNSIAPSEPPANVVPPKFVSCAKCGQINRVGEFTDQAAPVDHGDEVLRPGVNSCLADEVGLAVDHGEEELKKTIPCGDTIGSGDISGRCGLARGHSGHHVYF